MSSSGLTWGAIATAACGRRQLSGGHRLVSLHKAPLATAYRGQPNGQTHSLKSHRVHLLCMRFVMLKTYMISALMLMIAPSIAWGQLDVFHAYSEAVQHADVASAESGVIQQVLVEEGQWVEAGQPIVRLDDDLHVANLQIAQHESRNTSEIRLMEARVRLLQQTVEKLRELLASGTAKPLELERENAELEMATATLESKRHDYITKQHALERARVQLEKRTIRAPFSGRIAQLPKKQGEFISLTDPVVATLVDTSQLIAEFNLPIELADRFEIGQGVGLMVNSRWVTGTVDKTGVTVDPSSQLVSVRIKFENEGHAFPPGIETTLTPNNLTKSRTLTDKN